MFYEFFYEKLVEVYNNNLLLKSIFNKTILKVPPRIHRFLLQLQSYDFKMNYVKGSPLQTHFAEHRLVMKSIKLIILK